MTIIDIDLLKEGADIIRQFGNHVFARTADLVSVYEILTYEKYEPKKLKDLGTTYTITNSTTWNELVDRFFGAPTMPRFDKILNN